MGGINSNCTHITGIGQSCKTNWVVPAFANSGLSLTKTIQKFGYGKVYSCI